jgi:hypothetical protein
MKQIRIARHRQRTASEDEATAAFGSVEQGDPEIVRAHRIARRAGRSSSGRSAAEAAGAHGEPTDIPVEPTDIPVEPAGAPVEPTDIPVEPAGAPVESAGDAGER